MDQRPASPGRRDPLTPGGHLKRACMMPSIFESRPAQRAIFDAVTLPSSH